MKTNIFFLATSAVIVLSAFTFKTSLDWKISDNYSIKFISDDPTGVFKKMEGSIQFDENDLANSSFDVKVDVNSINTGKGMQNKHAVSDQWFDAENHPFIHFKSNKFSKTDKGYTVSGTMEIKGVKKPFEIPFTFKNNVFQGSFPVNRLDFGIGEEHKKVPEVLAVEISVPVTK